MQDHYCQQLVEEFNETYDEDVDNTRGSEIPDPMKLQEELIVPMAVFGYEEKQRLDAIKCLSFVNEEAKENLARREKLYSIQKELCAEDEQDKAKKKREKFIYDGKPKKYKY